ncbi:SusC/RagA family TonB-linked outer membrane protein [Ornithobacterium rhinotracheale]|uniref:SusC/RagA family TonB-linked outer membrane protein n=1 Tax=Ornithobacterium rhinotracheale TaxID=28251 RepID=UPI0040351D18
MQKLLFYLFVALISSAQIFTQAQSVTIQGNVVDENKEPVVGALIQSLKKKSLEAETDGEGNFEITVPKNSFIEVSFPNLETLKLRAKPKMNIVLHIQSQELKEVVVTGYQKVRKERMTGSVSTLQSSDLKKLNIKSIDNALAGNLSGVSVTTSGRPGADAQIHVRGVNSLIGNTEPIWIVDGMPLQGEVPNLNLLGGSLDLSLFQSGIGNLSPDDIESITVLKDAAASAIYGARAANGVIVIKTKSGKAGKVKYNVSATFGMNERPKSNLSMMNSLEKIQFEKEVYNDLESPTYGRVTSLLRELSRGLISQQAFDAELDRLGNINTDWFKELYRNSYSMQLNANMSGGTEKTQFYNSVNYLKENGIEYNNNYKRLRLRSRIDHKINDKISMQLDLSGTYRNNVSTASAINPLTYAIYANPYELPNDYDLSWSMTQSRIRSGLRWSTLNVKNEIERNQSNSRYLEGAVRAKLEWKPIKGLSIASQGIASARSNNTNRIEGEGTYTNFVNNWYNFAVSEILPEQVKGSLNEGTSYGNSYTLRNTIEYGLNINQKHYVDLFAGQEISHSITNTSFNYSPIFDKVHRIIGFPDLPEGIDVRTIPFSSLGNTGRFESKLVSFFFNGTYSYMDKYVLSGSVRYDGSDVIGNNNQFTPLWNVSGKWNVSKENFFESEIINDLSLRAGFGYTGSIDKNAFPFVLMKFENRYDYDNIIIPTSFVYANPNVKWQTKKDFNIGVESSWLNRRLIFGLNYYNNFVYDLLDRKALALSSGREDVVQNVANLRNKGWEFDLEARVIKTRDLSWILRGNLSLNKNIVTETFYENPASLPIIKSGSGNRNFVKDYRVQGWFGYRFAGVEPESGHTLVYDGNGDVFDMDRLSNVTLGLKAPTPQFLGDFVPPVVGGFSTSLNWREWSLNMNFEFKMGHYIRSFEGFSSISSRNRHISDKSRWRAPGDKALKPEISYNNVAYREYMYDSMLEKGDYLRNTFTSFGYNLPQSWLKNMQIDNARISIGANNLFTITKYKGIDPALMGSLGYPNTRSYNLMINIGF